MPNIKINDKSYATANLSETAKAHLASVQAADHEISRLKVQLAITQTARNAYARALTELLTAQD